MKRSLSPRLLAFLVLSSLMLLGTGCETTAHSAKPEKTEEDVAIQIGMPVVELVSLLGEPSFKESLDTPDGMSEIWIYERILSSKVGRVITGMRENTSYSAQSRQMITVQVPIMETNVIVKKEITRIEIVDGEVHSWKRRTSTDHQLSGKSR